MPALLGLYAAHNPAEDLSALSGFTQLLSLSVGGDCSTVTVTDLSPVAALTGLTTLYVECTTDADVADVANLKNIEMLAARFKTSPPCCKR